MSEKSSRFTKAIIPVVLLLLTLIPVSNTLFSEPPVQERGRRMRAEMRSPTTNENYRVRVELMRGWGNALATEGLLLIPQVMEATMTRLLTSGFNPQTSRMMQQHARILDFVERKGRQVGTVVREDDSPLVADEYVTLQWKYTVGEIEISPGQSLVLGNALLARQSLPQISDPSSDHFVSFQVSNPSVGTETTTTVWASQFGGQALPTLKVTSGTLSKGDRVAITLGDRSQGSRGYRLMWRDADQLYFPLLLDIDGKKTFVPLSECTIQIQGRALAGLAAVVPSVVGVEEAFRLRLRLEDEYNNPASFDGGSFTVRRDGRAVGTIQVEPGSSLGVLTGLRLDREGAYKFRVVSEDGKFTCLSNPILVQHNPKSRIYWGELHGHSGWEEGFGTVPRYYEYARDVAFLDFASLTGHESQLVDRAWEEIRQQTATANRAGAFVSYMGYEWSSVMRRGGHHNVFFRDDPGRYATQREAPLLPELYPQLKRITSADNILVIPHAHNPGDWTTTDAETERLVEIASAHGTFEYYGNRFLKRGYRIGLIAASDDHSGHPGASAPLLSTRNGLAAVYADGITRESIWQSMRERATYATTNAGRIVLRMSVGNRPVGTVLPRGTDPVIRARVLGTAAIEHIDVIRNGEVAFSKNYLRPEPGKPASLQLLFHSRTETPGDKVVEPLAGVIWQGWIELDRGRIEGFEILGRDHVSDEFHQVGDRRLWYITKTRGDFDGVLLELHGTDPDARIRVGVTSLYTEGQGPSGARLVGKLPGPPGDKAKHTVEIRLADIVSQEMRHDFTPGTSIVARTVNPQGAWDVAFSYRPTVKPEPNDYYYLRVVQIDGEMAWSSPVWIE